MPVYKLLLDYCFRDIKHEWFHSKYASKKYMKGKPLAISSMPSY